MNCCIAGQFFQSLYKDVSEMKGSWGFGYDRDAHTTEDSPLVTDHNRLKLYAEWRRFWDVVWTLGHLEMIETIDDILFMTCNNGFTMQLYACMI